MSFEFLKIDSQFLEIVTKHPTRFFINQFLNTIDKNQFL
jgi:hypothetical protein